MAEGQPTFWQPPREPQAVPDRAAFRELAYRLAGGAPAAPWWRESHERVLARARALAWPSRLVDVETQACQIVGDEFYDRFRSPETGVHPPQWLRALVEETGAALRAALAQGADDWQKLWALLRGLALTGSAYVVVKFFAAAPRASRTLPAAARSRSHPDRAGSAPRQAWLTWLGSLARLAPSASATRSRFSAASTAARAMIACV